jgi:short-subunit dehydrogenase
LTNENRLQAAASDHGEKRADDVLVNNAGYGQLGYFEEISEEKLLHHWKETFSARNDL